MARAVSRGRSGLTASVVQVAAILAGLQSAGADAELILARVGLGPDDFADPHGRLPRETMLALWQAALDVTGDEAFGLHLAEQIRPGTLDVLDYLARSSATLGDALARAARYARLWDDVAEIVIETHEDAVTLIPRLGFGLPIPPGVMEAVFAAALRIARDTTGVRLSPREVELTHAAPRDTSEHERVFGIPVRFSARRNGLTFTTEQLALPLVTADPALFAILDRHAQELLNRLPQADTFRHRVRALLASELRGDPSVDRIAARLHMSARTLRRRLEQDGTTLQTLHDELRSELAERYLGEQKMTLQEVAFEVGFADTRAFRRAFKRWTGRSPRQATERDSTITR